MKAYPIIIYPSDGGINHIDFPDMHTDGQAFGVADSFDMTHDGICLWAVTARGFRPAISGSQTLSLGVSEDFIPIFSQAESDLADSLDLSPAQINCTIPTWLADEVDRRGIDCSVVLQQALLQLLEQPEETQTQD